MRTFKVTIRNKKNSKEICSCTLKEENDLGIILKGRIRMLSLIKFSKKIHDISYTEIWKFKNQLKGD